MYKLDKKNVKRPYKCETCVIGFFSQKNYYEHMLCHMSFHNGPACLMCDVTFATEQGFNLHCRIMHDELKMNSATSEEQVKTITNTVKVQDTDAPLEALQENNHNWTIIVEAEVTPVEPTSNAVELKEIDGLLEALQENNKHNLLKRSQDEQADIEQSNRCYICDKTFTEVIQLKRHECKVYHKEVTLNYCLRHHERLLSEDKPYECNVYHKEFALNDCLKNHERLPNEDNSVCNIGTVGVKHPRNLNIPKISHGGNPHKCDICDKIFTSSSSLKNHEPLHTGDKRYECFKCGKRFMHLSSLRSHKITHTGARSYKCYICSRRYTDSSNLKRHQKLHSGDKPYTCDICDKKFTRSFSLKRHRIYKCYKSDKKSTQSGSLTRYEKSHSIYKPFRCYICDKGYTYLGCLKRHERVHKGDKTEC